MARPLPREQITALQEQKAIKYHSVVYYKGEPYTIFKDEIGPIYSCPSIPKELMSAGVRDTIWMEDGYDSTTHRVMGDYLDDGWHHLKQTMMDRNFKFVRRP